MGGQAYLIDTNVAIEYIGEVLPEKTLTVLDDIIDGQFYISVINKIELLGFKGITETERVKFQEFIDAAIVHELSDDIVDRTIEIRKHHKTKLPDAVIAATALVNELTIITRNTKDFIRMEGLEMLNPYEI